MAASGVGIPDTIANELPKDKVDSDYNSCGCLEAGLGTLLINFTPTLLMDIAAGQRPALHQSCVTTTFRDSGVGLAASSTAATVCTSGKRWVMRARTSSLREKTSLATSGCKVTSEE